MIYRNLTSRILLGLTITLAQNSYGQDAVQSVIARMERFKQEAISLQPDRIFEEIERLRKAVTKLKAERDILKKVRSLPRERSDMRFFP